MWIITSHIPLSKPKQASRNALELLCHSHLAKQKVFNPCPTLLTLAIWEVGQCAQTVLGNSGVIGLSEIHQRELVLLDVLSFNPEDGVIQMKDDYHPDISP